MTIRVHNILVSHSEESKQLSDHRVVVDGVLARTERVAVVVYELQELLEGCQGTVINNDWLSIAVNAAIDEELSLKINTTLKSRTKSVQRVFKRCFGSSTNRIKQ